MPVKRFFGDSDRTFTLTAPMVRELERLRGVGIGTLTNRMVAREFYHDDLADVVRLALIGGGTAPAEAKTLIDAYLIGRPIFEAHALALEILTDLWSGELKSESKEDSIDAAE